MHIVAHQSSLERAGEEVLEIFLEIEKFFMKIIKVASSKLRSTILIFYIGIQLKVIPRGRLDFVKLDSSENFNLPPKFFFFLQVFVSLEKETREKMQIYSFSTSKKLIAVGYFVPEACKSLVWK